MINYIKFFALLALSWLAMPVQAQTQISCNQSQTTSGSDGTMEVDFLLDSTCVPNIGVAVLSASTDMSLNTTWCGSWYAYNVLVDGNLIASEICGTYEFDDVSLLTSGAEITLQTVDLDNFNDFLSGIVSSITIEMDSGDCLGPQAVDFPSVGPFTATMDITNAVQQSTSLLWEVELVTAGTTPTGVATTTTGTGSVSFASLTPETDYEVYLRNNCSGGATTQTTWYGPYTFSTTVSCPAPTSVATTSVGTFSATLAWTGFSDTYEYELINVSTGGTFTGTPGTIGITDEFVTISGLTQNTDYSIRILGNCGPINGSSSWSNTVSFTTLPTCPMVDNFALLNVLDTAILFSWDSGGAESSWIISAVNNTLGETFDGSVDASTSFNGITLEGLSANNNYSIYIAGVCSPTDTADWAGPFDVQTACAASYAMPFVDDLSGFPNCYDLVGSSTNAFEWEAASGMARVRNWNFPSGDASFTSGDISITEQAIITFRWYRNFSSFYTDEVYLIVTNDNFATTDTVWGGVNMFSTTTGNNTAVPPVADMETTDIILDPSYIGTDMKFRFYAVSDFGPNFWIDEIQVRPVSDCESPFVVNIDTATGDAVTFSWVDLADNSTGFDYIIYDVSNTDTISGNVATMPATVTGLNPATNYVIELTTVCTGGDMNGPITATFQTECGALSNFFEGLEDYADSEFPICWTRLVSSNFVESSFTPTLAVETFATNTGTRQLRFYSNSNTYASDMYVVALTPELDSLESKWLRFFARSSFGADEVMIWGYVTDDTDPSSFVAVDSFAIAGNSYEELIVNPSLYPSFVGNRIALRYKWSGSFRSLYTDDYNYETKPECSAPGAIAVSGLTTNSATINFSPFNPGHDEWFYQLVEVSNGEVLDASLPGISTSSTTISLTGLQSSSTYGIALRSECATDTSDYGSLMIFQTPCGAVSNFFESFEYGGYCWSFNNASADANAINEVRNGAFASLTGSFYNRMQPGFNSTDEEFWTVSPQISNLSAGTHMFKINYRKGTNFYDNHLFVVGTMSDPNDLTTFNPIDTVILDNTSYQEYFTLFTNYTGLDNYLVYYMPEFAPGYNYFYFDDVSWEEIPACALPFDFETSALGDVTATVNWTPLSQNDTLYEYDIADVTLGTFFDGTPEGSTGTPDVTLTGLQPNTTYGIRVRNMCDTTLGWTNGFFFTTLNSNDLTVDSIISPVSQGCNLGTDESFVLSITNNGINPESGFTVSYSLDNGATFTVDSVVTTTLAAGENIVYTSSTGFDLTDDINVDYVWEVIPNGNDDDTTNNMQGIAVTSLGFIEINIEINTGSFSTEPYWVIYDTATAIVVAEHLAAAGANEYVNNSTYNISACVDTGRVYVMEAYDSYGDGWNGGTYEITACGGGTLLANNGGEEVSTPPDAFNPNQLEAIEFFTVDPCPAFDLGIAEVTGLNSGCGLTATETATISFTNFGEEAVTAVNTADIKYIINGSGVATAATLTNMAAFTDSTATFSLDLSNPGVYTIDVFVQYPTDENSSNDTVTVVVTSQDETEDEDQDFNLWNGEWYPQIVAGVAQPWQWGTPAASTAMSNGADGKIWATNLAGDADLNANAVLISPCYDFSSYTDDVEISFDYINFGFPATTRIDYSIDGGVTWIQNSIQIGTSSFSIPNSTTWTTALALLPDLTGESNVKFRLRMTSSFSGSSEGFGFDNWKVLEHIPYTDASLSDLTVDGLQVPGFDPAVFNYTFTVPFGTTNYPTIAAVPNAPIITSLDITQANGGAGNVGTVEVVAEDTNFSSTYTVTFEEALPNDNAFMQACLVVNTPLAGFDSNVTFYNYELPFGSTNIPPFIGIPADFNATVSTSVPSVNNLPDTLVMTVTAEDGITTMDYMILISIAAPDTVSTLNIITVNGTNVVGFDPATLNYSVEVPTTNPTITYAVTSPLSTAVLTMPASIPGTATIVVTAQSGDMTTYTVDLTLPPSDNAYLTDLAADGVTVTGFDSTVFTYTLDTLPPGAPLPVITWVTADTGATVQLTSPLTAPGQYEIIVIAEDGVTSNTYYINVVQSVASTNSLLASLAPSFGTMTRTVGTGGFSPTVFSYNICVSDPSQILSVPVMSAVAQDANAVVSNPAFAGYGTAITIVVTAEDGITTSSYVINLRNCIGLDELDADQVSMYPNPVADVLSLDLSSDIEQVEIQVFDLIGKSMIREVYSNDGTIAIDMNALSSGLYNVVVKDLNTGKIRTEKISVVK